MEVSEFEHIAVSLRQKVVGTGCNLGLSVSEAEDIAQNVMLKLWSMHESLEQYHSIDALAIVMAKRLILNERRKKTTLPLEENQSLIADNGNMPNELLEKDETETWIIKKIDALPTTQHTILYMRQVEKRSNTEIAQILGIQKDSVCALLSKARASLLSDFRQRIEAEEKRMSKL